MSSSNKSRRPYVVRVILPKNHKSGDKFKSVIVEASDPRKAAKKVKGPGRIVSVRKIPIEKVFGIGSFSSFDNVFDNKKYAV